MSEMNVDVGGGRQRSVRVDYPSNSRKSKEAPKEKEPVAKVVTNDVVQRKQGTLGKIAGNFLSEDSGSVVNYILMDVMLPAAKNMISDMVSQGIERMLFGDSRPRPGSGSRPGYTNYSSMGRRPDPVQRTMTRQARATHDFNDLILASRGEAEDVIDRLRDLIEQYEVATVSDLYDLVGLTGEFTDDKWGWYDLRSANVRTVRGGYLLNLPRTQPIA